eukprot:4786923-Prymnesium_polylepis.1
MRLAKSERTIASLLKARGYATVHMGKWHLSRPHAHVGYSPWHFGFGYSNGSFLPASELLQDFVGWLGSGRRADQRFFAYLALWEPHEPVHKWSPAAFQQLYAAPPGADGAPPALRAAGSMGSLPGGAARRASSAPEELAPHVASGGGGCAWRLPRRASPRVYYGCMSQVDSAFGALLASLERLRLREDSLIVFTSDNGPEHREANSWGSSGGLRGAKGYVYEGGIRVPLVVQWPALLRAPAVVHEPVHLWDLLPTICDVVGVPAPVDRTIDGVSLLPLLHPTARRVATVSAGAIASAYAAPAAASKETAASAQAAAAAVAAAASAAAAGCAAGLAARELRFDLGEVTHHPHSPPRTLPPQQATPLPLPRFGVGGACA